MRKNIIISPFSELRYIFPQIIAYKFTSLYMQSHYIFNLFSIFFVRKFDFRFSDYMPERFMESEIQIAIGNILKRAPDQKDSGGRQKTNNSEQGDGEQSDDEQGDNEQDH